jgi:ribosomal protein S18 acetylase RimI-like enzyme
VVCAAYSSTVLVVGAPIMADGTQHPLGATIAPEADGFGTPKKKSTRSKDHARWSLAEPTTVTDFRALCELKALAFHEKGRSARDSERAVRIYQTYQSEYPAKLKHCRLVRDPAQSNLVVGIIQVMCPGDPPDLTMPEVLRHDHLLPGEAYVEFIATHPHYTGRGIGTKLLAWAEECAKMQGCTYLSLDVMKKNAGAVRLYERQGYIIKRDPHDASNSECMDDFCTGVFLYCCLNCQYWTVLYMEKPLSSVPEGSPPAPSPGAKAVEQAIGAAPEMER